jgi:hypothetical protein
MFSITCIPDIISEAKKLSDKVRCPFIGANGGTLPVSVFTLIKPRKHIKSATVLAGDM